jgi:hypothetical protein
MITALLLFFSNIFMTLAWYGHLKFKDKPLWLVIVASWTLAFFEYLFQVPANRIGSARFTLAQLKVMQEMHHYRGLHDHRGAVVPADAALEQHRLVSAHRGGGLFHFQFRKVKTPPSKRTLNALDAVNSSYGGCAHRRRPVHEREPFRSVAVSHGALSPCLKSISPGHVRLPSVQAPRGGYS